VAVPVFITDRDKPNHALFSIGEDRRITSGDRKIAEVPAVPGIAKIAFDPPRANIRTWAAGPS
jgi:hypothetical protein